VNAAKPTVAELNDIQTQWMKLDPHAPDKEKNRVFALMKLYPRAYLSVDAAKANGSAMVDGCPVWASPRPIRDALRWLMDRHDRQLSARDEVSAKAIKVVTDAHEAVMAELGVEIRGLSDQLKAGFDRINLALEKRDDQQQKLFDKHLDVTIKVTEGLGGMGSRLADNTREIGELKAVVWEMQTRAQPEDKPQHDKPKRSS